MSTTSYSNWDFHNQRVQQDVQGGQFVSSESTLIAAGPPFLDALPAGAGGGGGSDASPGANAIEAYPIGLLDSFGLQQNRQLQRIFEIGSSRSYFIPGRTIGNLSLGRVFFYGPTLLRALYAYAHKQGAADKGTKKVLSNGSTIIDPDAKLLENDFDFYYPRRSPGEGHFWMDLASDMFSQPTGLAVYFKDMLDETLGAFYLQESYVQGHQFSVNSGSVLIMEGAQLQYETLVPIKVSV